MSISTEGVTEVFVTQVDPEKERVFRDWIAKMNSEEAKFPGFRGMYVQAPSGEGGHWLTFLHFDTVEHLDQWLKSPQRQEVLQEAKGLMSSLETHRISPYAGWFASAQRNEQLPSVWKQTMLILLVLFPIVMLESIVLPPLTGGLNPSLATFISNAISVSLLAWPMTPLAIRALNWWLLPRQGSSYSVNIFGTCLVVVLYMITIALFWR